MTTKPKIRVGLVGAHVGRGWGMASHVPALLNLPEYELVAVCTAHEETARESAAAVGARLAFWDYHEMVRHPDIDVVSVAIRVLWHKEVAEAAIEEGKHIYCEWPLAITPEQAEEMAAAANAKGVHSMVGLQGRYAAWVQRVRELIAEGYLGKVLYVDARMFMGAAYRSPSLTWAAQRSNGNHILTIQGGHITDMLFSIFGELTEVSAQIGTQVPIWNFAETGESIEVDVPDYVMFNGLTASGARIAAHMAYVAAGATGWRLEIYGDEGTIIATSPTVGHLIPNQLQGVRKGEQELQDLEVPSRLFTAPESVPHTSALHIAGLYQRFAEAIQQNKRMDPDFNWAVKRYRMLQALERSSDEGKRIAVPAWEAL